MNLFRAFISGVFIVAPAVGIQAAGQQTVAVIGTGDMGDSLGPRFAKLGYRVVYGSRTPDSEKVRALVQMTGAKASAASKFFGSILSTRS